MYKYYCAGSHMSADLKQVIKRVRKNRPEFFTPTKFTESTMDGEGKVTVTERMDVKAVAMKPSRRHWLSWQRETF